VLVSGKGCGDVIRADHGQQAHRAALVLKQKFPLASKLSYDDMFHWIH